MKGIIWFALVPDLIILDQISKWLALTFLKAPKILIPATLALKPSLNTGASWSVPIPNLLMAAITPLILGIIIYVLVKHYDLASWRTRLPLILLIGGGLGNLIDRLLRDGVVDFISFRSFPSFNLADIYITVAVFLLIVFYGKIARRDYGK